jgi:hypothetical protein
MNDAPREVASRMLDAAVAFLGSVDPDERQLAEGPSGFAALAPGHHQPSNPPGSSRSLIAIDTHLRGQAPQTIRCSTLLGRYGSRRPIRTETPPSVTSDMP